MATTNLSILLLEIIGEVCAMLIENRYRYPRAAYLDHSDPHRTQ